MTQTAMERYKAWLTDPVIDASTKEELPAISGNEKEIEDRFYRDLEFGTGGLRGVMGAGTNRMNVYTVGKATQGLASWILSQNKSNPSVVIAHDSRNNSPEFSLDAALVLAANGITAYLFKGLRPTPQLSFAVRALGLPAVLSLQQATIHRNITALKHMGLTAASWCLGMPSRL